MLFNSYAFLLGFLPAAILIYWFADKSPPWRTWVLILLSLVFYGYWDVRFLPLMIGSILFNWWLANLYVATRRYALIPLAVAANLAVLGFFKYTNFVADTFAVLLGMPTTHFNLVLPLGISFFTFHHIMYLVDLGRGRAPPYPLDRYALYICFFPQAIAGPIARWNEVIHQFGTRAFAPGWERRGAIGVTFIVVGLAEKVLLADPLGVIVDPIYTKALTATAMTDGRAWLATAFAFQVFFDFAGYSDIAIGLALIFGITLPINFDAPFRATTMIEFWQRWHMTLARFLRDYVFLPLARVPLGGSRYRIALFAILLTMALCGLWHGAGWTYVLWGTLQGLALIYAAVWRRYLPPAPPLLGWAATAGFFLVTSVIFRAGSLEAAWRIYQGMAFPPQSLENLRTIAIAAFCAIVLPASHVMVARMTDAPRPALSVMLAVASLVLLLQIAKIGNYEFVYFQF